MVEDITDQKNITFERTELKHRIIDSIEVERSHLARELRDNPLQTLNGALYLLAGLDVEGFDEENKQNIEYGRSVIRQAVNSIRTTCGELRSPMLNTFGLKKGIDAYVEQFRDLHPEFHIKLQINVEGKPLSERVTLALYQILQESLSNVLKHSQAAEVKIAYKQIGDLISLRIKDNGVGFEVPARMANLMCDGHYGLSGIAE